MAENTPFVQYVENVSVNYKSTLPFLFEPFCFVDARGSFTKIFSNSLPCLETTIDTAAFHALREVFMADHEVFSSCSAKNVFRGFHYISPVSQPHTSRIMTVTSGRLIDFLVNVDPLSTEYGSIYVSHLSHGGPSLFIPSEPTYAHGFLSLEDNTSMTYFRSTSYLPESDKGYHYSLCAHLLTQYVSLDLLNISSRDLSLPYLPDLR